MNVRSFLTNPIGRIREWTNQHSSTLAGLLTILLTVELSGFEIGAGGGGVYLGAGGNDTINGSVGNDLISGGGGSDTVDGGDGDDIIFGGSHTGVTDTSSDTLNGGAGDDWLFGGLGSDVYIYDLGDGLDTLVETDSTGSDFDTLMIGPGIDFADVGFEIEDADLIISASTIEIIRIRHWYLSRDGSTQIEEIVFDDLTIVGPNDLPFVGVQLIGTASSETLHGATGQINRIFGGSGNDTIYGKNLDDVIGGEAGNDIVYGGDGIDIISGGHGNDTLNGENGNDRLFGGEGIDTLNGGAGADELNGGLGDDSLQGGAGSDVYYWNLGDGFDTVVDSVTDVGAGIVNHLIFGPGVALGEIRGDSVPSFPNDVRFVISKDGTDIGSVRINNWSSSSNGIRHGTRWTLVFADGSSVAPGRIATQITDRLEGGAGSDTFAGLGGTDFIYGHDGNDVLDGGDGSDYLYGGGGNDLLIGGAGSDQLIGGDGNDSLDGGSGDDTLLGENGDDTIIGGDGIDTLSGASGNDSLNGGAGVDSLSGGDGADLLVGGNGNDTLNGGNGIDRYAWNIGDGEDVITDSHSDTGSGIINTLVLGPSIVPSDLRTEPVAGQFNAVKFIVSQNGVDVGSVRINDWSSQYNGVWHGTRWSIEFNGGTIWPTGTLATQIADRFDGGSGNDSFAALGGNDLVNGYDGADTLDGGEGNDSISGGNGADTLNGGGGNDTMLGGEGADVIDGGAGNDVMNGGAGNDLITAGAGADVINAGQGNDTLTGGTENDTLRGDAGSDTYNWSLGDGDDTVNDDYFDTGAGIVNTLIFGPGILPSDVRGDAVSGDNNAVRFVVSQNSVAVGSIRINNWALLSNSIRHSSRWRLEFANGTVWAPGTIGTNSADSFVGNAGNETFLGLGGNDTIHGYGGSDLLDGGDGNDSMFGGDGNDSLNGGNGDDSLSGEAGDDVLNGGGGVDGLYGGTGNDELTGGGGNDILEGGTGSDVYVWNLGDGDDTIGDVWTDVAPGVINRLIFGPGIAPTDVRGDVDPHFTNDVRFVVSQSGVDVGSVRIRQWIMSSGGVTHSTRWAFEFHDGTVWAPGSVATDVADRFDGGSGDDSFAGLGGNDDLYGNDGNDSLDGGTGNDFVSGGIGADALFGGTGNDSLFGGIGDDSIEGGEGDDSLNGEDGSDILLGGGGADVLNGGAGDDQLAGGDGVDTLNGGSGDDELTGGAGNDTVSGGSGNDLYFWNLGDGNDSFSDDHTEVATGIVSRLVFGPGIVASQVSLESPVGSPSAINVVISPDGIEAGRISITNWNNQTSGIYQRNRWIFQFEGGETYFALQLPTNGDDALVGTAGDDILFGYAGDDSIVGNGGNDYIKGGEGDDHLTGGLGSDAYAFDPDDGSDIIVETDESGAVNQILFGPGVLPSDILLFRVGERLVLYHLDSHLDIAVDGWFESGANRISEVVFDDTTVWDALYLGTQALVSGDHNADGVDDLDAWVHGIDIRSLDHDGDGLSNADEITLGYNPFRADSDGDGEPDATDYNPLDPTVSAPPASGTGPINITIHAPANAVLAD